VSDANVWSDEWGEQQEDWSGGGALVKRLVPHGPFLGASLYELGPGNFTIYHAHHGSDELLIVLSGRPTLRTPDGERQLDAGDAVHFPPGRGGAHGMRNDTDEPVRYVVAGTRVSPEVVEYPDLGRLTAQSRLPSYEGNELFVIHDVKESE
jgi:uncharacterized cupin superfamily protein